MLTFLALIACASSIKLGPADSGVDPDAGAETPDSGGGDTGGTTDSATDSGTDTGGQDSGADTGSADDCLAAGLVADQSLLLEGGTAVLGYEGGPFDGASSTRARVAVNSTAPCAANVSGTVDGDLWLVGDPETALCLGYGGTVEGTTSRMAAALAVTGATPPARPASSGALVLAYAGAQTLTSDVTYDGVVLGGASTLTVDGDVDLFVAGDFSSAGTITLTEGSRLHLWVEGAARFDWATQVNPSGASEQVVLDMLGEGEATFSWDSRAVLRVTHPYARVNLEGGTLVGTVAAKEVRATWGSTVHVDMSEACDR